MNFAWGDPQTMWVNIANITLGAVVVICCLVVAFGVAKELAARARRRAVAARPADDGHAFDVPGLGWTMADGGEPVDEKRDGRK